jgi:2-(3-amino-3-carboxypropyl)histidine synthase
MFFFVLSINEPNTDLTLPNSTISSRRKQEFEMPRDLAENKELDDAIARTLPANYNFEIKKTLWRMRRANAKRVAIQFPEGLLIFSCPISDLLERYGSYI